MTNNSTLLGDITKDRLSLLEQKGISPQEFCLSVGRTSKVLNNPISDVISFSPEQLALYQGFSNLRELGVLGQRLHQQALNRDTIICVETNEKFRGSYNLDTQTVHFELHEDKNGFSASPTTMLEEFFHASQDQAGLIIPLIEDETNITHHDKFIAALSAEAQAKLAVAREAVNSYWEGDTAIYDTIRLDSSVDYMALHLMDRVSTEGLSILDDPDTLFETYKLFFTEPHEELGFYTQHYIPGIIEGQNGKNRISENQYANAFGTLNDDSGINFLAGNITDIDEIASIIHDGGSQASSFLQYFTQFLPTPIANTPNGP